MEQSAPVFPTEPLAAHIPYAHGSGAFLHDKRRTPPGEKSCYQIKQLWERQHEILRRVLLGQKQVDIARDMRISPVTVSNTLNSELAQEKLTVMMAERDASTIDLSRQIKEIAPKALEIIKDALNSNTLLGAKDRVKVAQDMLDRAGYSPVQLSMSANMNVHLTRDDLSELKARAVQAARRSGVMKDVTPTSESSSLVPASRIPVQPDLDVGVAEVEER